MVPIQWASSALLAIDFVFGGNTYLESEVNFRRSTIFFAYEFDGQRWDFARSTSEPDVIVHCDRIKLQRYNLGKS